MIRAVSHLPVYVLDQNRAKQFYTEKLGFELRQDVVMGEGFEGGGAGFRWLTVSPPAQPDVEVILSDISMGHDPDSADQLRALVAKGAMAAGVLSTDDCQATFAELTAKGVEFVQEPARRPYALEAVFRDDSGNWWSLSEARP